MGKKFDPSRVDAIAAKVKAGGSRTATYAISKLKPEFTSIRQSEIAQKPRPDRLQRLIVELVRTHPSISTKELLRELERRVGCGVILSITDETIEFLKTETEEGDEELACAPVSGLKDRLSHAKGFVNQDSR